MCCSIFRNFTLSKNKVKSSVVQANADGVMVRSECDVHIISSNDSIGCIRFLPNKKKIVNDFNTRRLVWNCRVRFINNKQRVSDTHKIPTSLCGSACYCSCPLLKLVERYFISTDSILSSYYYTIGSDWLEITNDIICVGSFNRI